MSHRVTTSKYVVTLAVLPVAYQPWLWRMRPGPKGPFLLSDKEMDKVTAGGGGDPAFGLSLRGLHSNPAFGLRIAVFTETGRLGFPIAASRVAKRSAG